MENMESEAGKCERQIDCMTVGRVRSRRRTLERSDWIRAAKRYLKDGAKALSDALTLIGTGCFLGIGFGIGLVYAMTFFG